jgi:hydroxymethylbilane synthase
MVVCRNQDKEAWEACRNFNDEDTALCVKIERDFLKTLMGGCSTPISALAQIENGNVVFKGNIVAPDGSDKVEVEKQATLDNAADLGVAAAEEILKNGAADIVARLGIRS